MLIQSKETDKAIYGFFGKYRPLSNFDTTPFTLSHDENAIVFKSSEHAFHYHKTLDKGWQEKILNAETPAESKRLGRLCPLREDWDKIKVATIEKILYSKFSQNQHLKELLLSTGDKYLEETNDWNDTFWGVCDGVGENNLGKCLMNIRKKLRNEGYLNFNEGIFDR
jgi:ribA/ribD-fused uncharacterized protein